MEPLINLPTFMIEGSSLTCRELAQLIGFDSIDPRINMDALNETKVRSSIEFSRIEDNVCPQRVIDQSLGFLHLATLHELLYFVYILASETERADLQRIKYTIFALGTIIEIGAAQYIPCVEIKDGLFRLKLFYMGDVFKGDRNISMKILFSHVPDQ